MADYSHSKVSTYENCPFQYKLKYVDKAEVDIPATIEAFMGGLVHQTLEKMYSDKKFQKKVSKKILLDFYGELWEKEYSDDLLIVKKEYAAENYRKMGAKFISDYFDSHQEDDMIVLDLETEDQMTLPDGNQWHVRIDKLGCKGDVYFVCDYKTNSRMKTQEEADSDRQLAMYSVWVKDKFKDAKKVVLKWYMLAFDKEVTAEKSDAQLKTLQEDVMRTIKEIEKATQENNFPRNQSALCDYCVYKQQCPSFKHEAILEEKTKKEYKEDEGLKLVDELSEVKKQLQELTEKEVEVSGNLIDYAKQLGVDAVYGSNSLAKVKEFDKITLPEDKEEFLDLMKKKGVYDSCSMICYPKIQSKFLKGELDKDVAAKMKREKDWRISLSKRKDVEEDGGKS